MNIKINRHYQNEDYRNIVGEIIACEDEGAVLALFNIGPQHGMQELHIYLRLRRCEYDIIQAQAPQPAESPLFPRQRKKNIIRPIEPIQIHCN